MIPRLGDARKPRLKPPVDPYERRRAPLRRLHGPVAPRAGCITSLSSTCNYAAIPAPGDSSRARSPGQYGQFAATPGVWLLPLGVLTYIHRRAGFSTVEPLNTGGGVVEAAGGRFVGGRRGATAGPLGGQPARRRPRVFAGARKRTRSPFGPRAADSVAPPGPRSPRRRHGRRGAFAQNAQEALGRSISRLQVSGVP
mgnify:CR=1 FL=1